MNPKKQCGFSGGNTRNNAVSLGKKPNRKLLFPNQRIRRNKVVSLRENRRKGCFFRGAPTKNAVSYGENLRKMQFFKVKIHEKCSFSRWKMKIHEKCSSRWKSTKTVVSQGENPRKMQFLKVKIHEKCSFSMWKSTKNAVSQGERKKSNSIKEIPREKFTVDHNG